MKSISKLHFITTNAAAAELACKGGVNWVQLRLKNVTYEQYKQEALKAKEVCTRYNAALIINDNVQLAADVGADGVHIGSTDMTPTEARALLGENFIIGCTANTLDDVVRLSALPVNYIGLGPFRYTTTKQNLSPVLGWEGYDSIMKQLTNTHTQHPPIVGIGGIILHDVPSLMGTGIHGIAISGAISNASDVSGKATDFINIIENKNIERSSPSGTTRSASVISEGVIEVVANGIVEIISSASID